MSVHSIYGESSNDPKLELFHASRVTPIQVICVKDNPPMRGFGKQLKKGNVVTINGTVNDGSGFQVSCPEECAFYDYTYFQPVEEVFNR